MCTSIKLRIADLRQVSSRGAITSFQNVVQLGQILNSGLPDNLSENQKKYKIGDLLKKMKKLEKIKVDPDDKRHR